ncbi:16S rRNA (cytidine(1402)-2'-O)-methyltransferase [Sulfobacillus thermotolerans]|uniref:Ribosomal RNA small subunit methyltransferase I n=1 Tax=Sulfobacillus thermotolerans TaxID=338644 RepID=A0ABN5GWR4_9FIRM|nr:16S rRNA (cytidine(1402)-2'-O)-methyltransferase [Sulfobacillus thermotolerans]
MPRRPCKRLANAEERRWVEPGHVYLVGTPIGNLEDFSPRGQAVLRQVDRILCEDTRETEILCRQFGITRPLVSFHAHNAQKRLPLIAQWLTEGQSLAMVSDRGMPAVSDPGQELVAFLYQHAWPFTVVPGPSAQVVAYAASGYPHPYVFWGFLPNTGKARAERVAEIAASAFTGVLYIAPHHMEKTLETLAKALGSHRQVTVGRELTKRFEEFWQGTLGDLLAQERMWRGELVLVLAPPGEVAQETDWEACMRAVEERVEAGEKTKEAIEYIASTHRVSRRELYNRIQSMRRNN